MSNPGGTGGAITTLKILPVKSTCPSAMRQQLKVIHLRRPSDAAPMADKPEVM